MLPPWQTWAVAAVIILWGYALLYGACVLNDLLI